MNKELVDTIAEMIGRTNLAFSAMADSLIREMQKDNGEITDEDPLFSTLVQIDKDCSRLSADMVSLRQYLKTWDVDTSKRDKAERSFFHLPEDKIQVGTATIADTLPADTVDRD